LLACSLYENPPVFFSADSQDFGGLDIADKIQLWMHRAAQVSTGGLRQVLENGQDVCNSESDSENEDHGEVLSGMYAPDIPLDSNGNPIDARHKLSEAQANALRAQAAQSSRPTTQASDAGLSEPTIHSLPKGKLASEPTAPKESPKSEHPIHGRTISTRN
jgi:hypothetical protein